MPLASLELDDRDRFPGQGARVDHRTTLCPRRVSTPHGVIAAGLGLACRRRTLSMSNDEHESWPDRCAWSNATTWSATTTGAVDLDVAWLVPADLSAIDALARLQVAASRRGRWLQLHGADGGLAELLEFVGLGDVVHLCPCCRSVRAARRTTPSAGDDRRAPPTASGNRFERKAEQFEQRRVQERRGSR